MKNKIYSSKYVLKAILKDKTVVQVEGYADSIHTNIDIDFVNSVFPALKHYLNTDVEMSHFYSKGNTYFVIYKEPEKEEYLDIEPGYYWIRFRDSTQSEIALYEGFNSWSFVGNDLCMDNENIEVLSDSIKLLPVV